MKTKILLFLTFISLLSCSKDDSTTKKDPTFKLPPETQTGANTFGVTINGKVYIPRDPTGINIGGLQPKGMYLQGIDTGSYSYNEIVVVDGASTVGFKIFIHLHNFVPVGNYNLSNSNFQNGIDSVLFNNIFFKIFNYNIKNYVYYGSVENQSFLKITRRDNGIISGTFSGKFVRFDDSNEFIQITDGRFDINSFTLPDATYK